VQTQTTKGDNRMKNETVASLLESGELQRTDDILMMLDTILTLLTRGTDGEPGGDQFLGYAFQTLMMWRDSLDTTDTTLADEAIANIVSGKL